MLSTLGSSISLEARDADLLIVGAGPAGISLALEATRLHPNWRIVLLEAGGLEPPTLAQRDAYAGTNRGASYPITTSRLRYFGGTSGHWGGWCRPLDRIDFEPRPQARSPGWPIDYGDLQSYYLKAAVQVELPSSDFAASGLAARHVEQLIDWGDSSLFRNQLFRFSPPTRFGQRYREAIKSAPVQALLGATVCAYDWQDRRLSALHVRADDGSKHRCTARRIVLAMGGIESTRHLLLMQRDAPKIDGLASSWNGVGFADHYGVRPGSLWLPSELGYRRHDDESGALMAVISPSENALRQRDWNNNCMILEPSGQRTALVPEHYVSNRALGFSGRKMWQYDVQMIAEPRTVPASRISLDSSTDAFGLPRVSLNWQVDTRDIACAVEQFAEFGREISALGLGRGRHNKVDVNAVAATPSAACHHLGMARMSTSAKDGVVDANLRVHGSDNLFVLSTATFPTCGFSNPTLTLCALAFRLATQLEAA